MSKICPNCNSENDDSSLFCQECGNSLKGVTVQTDEANKNDSVRSEQNPSLQSTYSQPYQPGPAPQPAYSQQQSTYSRGYQTSQRPNPAADPTTAVASTSSFFFLMFLFALPGIGLIITLISCLAMKNKNKKHFACAFMLWYLVAALLSIIGVVITLLVGGTMLAGLGSAFNEFYSDLGTTHEASEDLETEAYGNLYDFDDTY